MNKAQATATLKTYAAKYVLPDTQVDVVQFVEAQLRRGICVVRDRWHENRIAVIAFGDRFSRRDRLPSRVVTIVYADGTSTDVKVKALDFIIGCTRRIYWPPGARNGGQTSRMFQHLNHRWRSGW